MKERPILFSAPMVRAILAGNKTQTRRVVKQKYSSGGFIRRAFAAHHGLTLRGAFYREKTKHFSWLNFLKKCFHPDQDIPGHVKVLEQMGCPHGKPGDRLWVKETWAPMIGGGYVYAADYTAQRLKKKDGHGFWKPSIFCKREASRITLEIVSVRVERLQGITEADALAEGIEPVQMPTGEVMYEDYLLSGGVARPVSSYATLWASINGPESWAANPWVWVIEFQTL